MIEHIKFLTNAIYQRGYYGDVYTLAQIEHPRVIDILLEIATSPDIKENTREIVIDAMVYQDDPRGHDLLIEKFQEKYRYSYNMLCKIGRLQDKRIIPTLISTLENLDNIPRFPRTKIINNTIRLLGTLQAEQAIPVLENILETRSFVSAHRIMPDKPFAMYALEALHEIGTPEAQAIAEKWDKQLEAHVAYHLKKGSFLEIAGKGRSKFRISKFVATRPEVIDYMLREYDTADGHLKNAIIDFLGNKMKLIETQPNRYQQIIECLLNVAGHEEDIRLRRIAYTHLVKIEDERVIPLALAGLEESILRIPSIEILTAHGYTQAIHRIVELLEDKDTPAVSRATYFNYLAMVGNDLAEQSLEKWIYDTSHRESNRRAFHALSKLAKSRDSAFEAICYAIDHKHGLIYDSAIRALRNIGEAALPVLISLVELNDHRRLAAIKALALPVYADAVPYLMPLLISSNQRLSKTTAKTLRKIASEPAFAALNAHNSTMSH